MRIYQSLFFVCLCLLGVANAQDSTQTPPKNDAPAVLDSQDTFVPLVPTFTPTPMPSFEESQGPSAVEAVPEAAVAPVVANDPMSQFKAKEQVILDSISLVEQDKVRVKGATEAGMPSLRPKDEFETSQAYDARKAAWEKERDNKARAGLQPLDQQLAKLQKSLQDLKSSIGNLQGELEITSSPKGAKVLLDGKEVGKTPLTLKGLWAGKANVTLVLDQYLDFVATPEVRGGKSTEIECTLQEKSIFSQVNELNLSALLAKDSATIGTYQTRIVQIQARIVEVDQEIVGILSGLSAKYPLQPKSEFETAPDFEKRKATWLSEGQKRYADLQSKHQVYRTRLTRAIEVLNDYILVLAGIPKTLPIPAEALALGTYNADQQNYPIIVEHRENAFALRFEGNLGMPLAEAKTLNKQTHGFSVEASYYNIPVQLDGQSVYPAWAGLKIAKAGKTYPQQGTFKVPALWMENASIQKAVMQADSLRKGLIEARGLDADYALSFQGKQSNNGLRIVGIVARSLILAAGLAGFGYSYKLDQEAADLADAYNPVNASQGVTMLADIRSKEKDRDNALIAGSLFTLAGAISFAF